MKYIITAVLIFTISAVLILMLAGCGGKQASNTPAAPPEITGDWKVVLSQNDLAIALNNPTIAPGVFTEVAFIAQHAPPSVPTGLNLYPVYVFDYGCIYSNGSNTKAGWDSFPGGNVFPEAGTIDGHKVTFAFGEDVGIGGNKVLRLTGTLQADGTMNGTYTDDCIPPSTTPLTWFAQHIDHLPSPGDPNP